jgi:hypothetical protein
MKRAFQQGVLGIAEFAGIVGFGCTGLSTGLRVRSDRILAMGLRLVKFLDLDDLWIRQHIVSVHRIPFIEVTPEGAQ